MLVLMIAANLVGYMGTGPIYPNKSFELNGCKDTWWTNMLFIQNFVKSKEAV